MRLAALCLLAAPLWAATGDVSAVRVISNTCTAGISCNGWVAEIDLVGLSTGGTYSFGLGTNNDPSAAKVVFTVTSPGYDTSGSTTTITRTVYGTYWLRKPYPNQTAKDETAGTPLTVRVVLSDFIYSSDTATVTIASGFYTGSNAVTALAVTNNSTLAYPKAIGHFAIEQRRPVNGTQAIEVFAVQRFAKDAKPLAMVRVTATGATSGHSETGTATAMTLSARGDSIPVYAVSLNLSTGAGFTRGELVNINFTAYPWVGNSGAVLDATTDAGTQIYQLGPLTWTIMDKMIAVVDPGSGNDSTCVASTVQATADAAPCATQGGALTKIAAQNNTSYSLNRVDGGEVQLKAGTYNVIAKGAQATTNGYFTITPHSSTNRAGVVFQQSSAQYQYNYERYKNITVNRSGNGYLVFAANPNVLVMEGVNFADSATAWYSGDTNTNVEFLDSITSNGKFSPGGNDGHARLNRNNTYTSPSGSVILVGDAACVLGLKGSGGANNVWNAITGASYTNVVIAYSKWMAATDGYFVFSNLDAITGMALVNNLVERIGASATPLLEISDADVSNVLFWHNSFAGQRVNHENDIAAAYVNKTFLNWGGKHNIFTSRGDHRADILDSTTGMSGTWNVGYSIGWAGNHNEAIGYSGDTDFWGINSNTPTAPATGFTGTFPVGYVSDLSRSGGDTGNGNYHLGPTSSALLKVPSGGAVLPYDLEGNPRLNNGTGAAGAYEVSQASTVRRRLIQ